MSKKSKDLREDVVEVETVHEFFDLCKKYKLSPKGVLKEIQVYMNRQQRLLELQESEERLIQLSKMEILGQMTSMLIHELKQPLNTLSVGVSTLELLLKKEPFSLTSIHKVLTSMKNQVLNSSNLINTISDFNRGGLVGKSEVELAQLLHSVVQMIEKELLKEGITLQIELPCTDCKVFGDKVKLQQLFLNLVLNAKDAIIEKKHDISISASFQGKIEIELLSAANSVEVVVKDNGIGIQEKHREKIFDLFFTTKPTGKGTGLGLVIVKNIIEQHEGNVEMESQYLEGTTFTLTFQRIFSVKNLNESAL